MNRRYNRGGPPEASGGPWEEERPRLRDGQPLRDVARRTVLVMGPGGRRGGPMTSPVTLEPSSGYSERPHGGSPLLTARQGPPPSESAASGGPHGVVTQGAPQGGPQGAPGGTRKLSYVALSDIIRQQNLKGKVSSMGRSRGVLQARLRGPRTSGGPPGVP